MEEIRIKAEKRGRMGKGNARKLRKEGVIPAVLYGKDVEPLTLAISLAEWRRLQGRVRGNMVLKMELKDDDATRERPVMVKEIQRTAVSDTVLHIDFLQVSMERNVQVEVPVHITGTAKGVVKGGVLEQHLRAIMVECLPGQIPEKLDVDVTELEIGDSIHVHEVSMPGIRLLEPPDVAIVGVTPPEAEEVKPVAEVTEVTEVAEAAPEKKEE